VNAAYAEPQLGKEEEVRAMLLLLLLLLLLLRLHLLLHLQLDRHVLLLLTALLQDGWLFAAGHGGEAREEEAVQYLELLALNKIESEHGLVNCASMLTEALLKGRPSLQARTMLLLLVLLLVLLPVLLLLTSLPSADRAETRAPYPAAEDSRAPS